MSGCMCVKEVFCWVERLLVVKGVFLGWLSDFW